MVKLLLFIFLIDDVYQFNDTTVDCLGPSFPPDPGADNVPPTLGLTGALSLAGYHHPSLASGALPVDVGLVVSVTHGAIYLRAGTVRGGWRGSAGDTTSLALNLHPLTAGLTGIGISLAIFPAHGLVIEWANTTLKGQLWGLFLPTFALICNVNTLTICLALIRIGFSINSAHRLKYLNANAVVS